MAVELVVIPEGKVCDYIDNKFRNDTPEVPSLASVKSSPIG